LKYFIEPTLETEKMIPVVTVGPDIPDVDQLPRVLVIHGLHDAKNFWVSYMYGLAQAGFVAVAPDLRLHGERADAVHRDVMLEKDFAGAMREIVYDTAKDVRMLLDVWAPRNYRWGLVGISAGGFIAHVLALEEKRIEAMSIVLSSPDWLTVDPEKTPHLLTPAGQVLAALSPVNHHGKYAPVALQMLNGDGDMTVRHVGSVKLHDRLKPVYKAKGISDRLDLRIYPGYPHEYKSDQQQASLEWLQRWLLK
jgi:pimeloyl-ACP methyl ester carboxylesterase